MKKKASPEIQINPRILISLIDRKQKNLGGQERRWARITNILKSNSLFLNYIISDSLYKLSSYSDAKIEGHVHIVNDYRLKIIDLFMKNLRFLILAKKFDIIHISTQSAILLPTVFILKYFFKKIITFSYNGTSLLVHKKNKKIFNYFTIITCLHKISTLTEILNPILLQEGWLDPVKTRIAPCSFSDPLLYKPSVKKRKIIFSGHLYHEKGLDLLKKVIISSIGRGFEICIYGDYIDHNKSSIEFKKWINIHKSSYQNVRVMHSNNMSGLYSDASIFLSFQTISNYPSQSVIEALYSGCSILMVDTGDSRNFGEYQHIKYIDSSIKCDIIWKYLEELHLFSSENFNNISNVSINNNSSIKYCEHLINFFKAALIYQSIKS
jgi:glycosyltransferase involved in cell wall biosynthesis